MVTQVILYKYDTSMFYWILDENGDDTLKYNIVY